MVPDFILGSRKFLFKPSTPTRRFNTPPTTLWLYQALGYVIIMSSSLTCMLQFFGNPIHCHLSTHSTLSKDLFEAFCWIEGIHSIYQDDDDGIQVSKLPRGNRIHFNSVHVHGKTVDDDGVGSVHDQLHENSYFKRKLSYYQFVPVVLLIQGVMALYPYKRWQRKSNDEVQRMALKDLYDSTNKLRDPNDLAQEFKANRATCKALFMRYIVYVMCLLIMAFMQLAFTDIFLGADGLFWNLGFALIGASSHQLFDSGVTVKRPLRFLFPRRTKCESFYYIGPNGNPTNSVGICILPLNNIIEKLYVILWIGLWLVILLTIASLIWLLAVTMSSHLRVQTLKRFIPENANVPEVLAVVPVYGVSEWFVLTRLAEGMFKSEFADLMIHLREDRHRPDVREHAGDGYRPLGTVIKRSPSEETTLNMRKMTSPSIV